MKIGVIDIGTRAIRLIIGDTDDIQNSGFSFDHYANWGKITSSGSSIRPAGDGSFFCELQEMKSTIKCLDDFVNNECPAHGVPRGNIYAVGTELFRRVSNWRDLVTILDDRYSFNLKVLHPLEEAKTSLYAALISCRKFYNAHEPLLVIEQGGGSTQVTVAGLTASQQPSIHCQFSVSELGMVLLRQRFRDYKAGAVGNRSRVGSTRRDVLSFAEGLLNQHDHELKRLDDINRPRCAFGLGTVITDVYPKLKSRSVHGRQVSLEQLSADIPESHYLSRYANFTIESLYKDVGDYQIEGVDLRRLEKDLDSIFGLPCYAAILNAFGLGSLQICGTGLRYGVFFRIAYGDWKDVKLFE